MKKYFCPILLILMINGCATPSFTSNSAPKLTESWTKTEDITPIAVGEVNGKQFSANEIHRAIAVNREAASSKQPFLARVWAWFIGLGVLGGLLAFFFPTAFFALVLWLLNKYKKLKEAYLAHKTALEETVAGIKEANVVTPEVAKVLDANTSDATKVLVGQIKATL